MWDFPSELDQSTPNKTSVYVASSVSIWHPLNKLSCFCLVSQGLVAIHWPTSRHHCDTSYKELYVCNPLSIWWMQKGFVCIHSADQAWDAQNVPIYAKILDSDSRSCIFLLAPAGRDSPDILRPSWRRWSLTEPITFCQMVVSVSKTWRAPKTFMFVDLLLILVSWAERVEIHKDYNFRDIETVRMPDFYSDEELQMLQPALDGILHVYCVPPPKETERNLWVFVFGLSSQLVALDLRKFCEVEPWRVLMNASWTLDIIA